MSNDLLILPQLSLSGLIDLLLPALLNLGSSKTTLCALLLVNVWGPMSVEALGSFNTNTDGEEEEWDEVVKMCTKRTLRKDKA